MTQAAELPGGAALGRKPEQGPRLNLLRYPLVKKLITHRFFQFALIVPNFLIFALVIWAGFFGTPVGNANFAIIFTWIVWWGLLIMLLIPLGARVWCTMCPIPGVGEWIQRRAVVRQSNQPMVTLAREWPKPLRNIWVQNFAFLTVAAFSAIILTRPLATGIVLLGFVVIALGLFLVYRRRAFCRYVCPVSGFIGLYSAVAPLELRVIDENVCLGHCGVQGKECIKGSDKGYGCPWMEYPGALERNAYCGMCTECLKTCPLDNIGINLRPFGADLMNPKRHLDEAFKGFIMLTAAIFYSVVMAGPWGWIKDWANLGSGSILNFVGYVAFLVLTALVAVPALFYLATWLGRWLARVKDVPVRRLFIALAYTTVPLGLAAWIAFSIGFLLVNVSYAVPLLSDPFGWGWDMFGTADYEWTPYLSGLLPYLQVPVLMVGLALSIVLGRRIAEQNVLDTGRAQITMIPVTGVLTLLTITLLWLYVG
jgi:hypothetical protein